MTFAKALSDLRETLLDAIGDLKASVSSKHYLADEVAELKAKLAAADEQIKTRDAETVALGEKLTETEEALEAERVAHAATSAKVAELEAAATSAGKQAAAIVASVGVKPVTDSGAAEPDVNKVELAASIAAAKRAGNHAEAKRLAAQFKKLFR